MLLSSSNRKYPPFPLLSYFSVVVCLRCCYIIFCHFLYIHSGKTGNLFSLVLCSLWWVQIVGYVLPCRSPKHKAFGDWSYMVHRPRLITVFRNHAQVETVNIVFVWYSSSKSFYANRAIKPPSHIIWWSFVMLLVGPGGKKIENKNDDELI